MTDNNRQDSPFISRKYSDSSDPFLSRKHGITNDQGVVPSQADTPSINSRDINNNASVVIPIPSDISSEQTTKIEKINPLIQAQSLEVEKNINSTIVADSTVNPSEIPVNNSTKIEEIKALIGKRLSETDNNKRTSQYKQGNKKLYIRIIVYSVSLVIFFMLHKHL